MAIEKIVVVDDEMMIRKALETQLRNKRYSVASTGDLKGERKIQSWDSFDLIEDITSKTDGHVYLMMKCDGYVEFAIHFIHSCKKKYFTGTATAGQLFQKI